MENGLLSVGEPMNEPLHGFAPGSLERSSLKEALKRIESEVVDIPIIIGGEAFRNGNTGKVVMPHCHGHVLATYHKAGREDVERAVARALEARRLWENTSWTDRAAVMLKIAELICGKYRDTLLAATMAGQSKNAYQAEIDAVAESADFLRFNVRYASSIYSEQPKSGEASLNRVEYRPLEGFVYAVTPFNFTAIASNLVLAPALMGNVVLWKPATNSLLSSYYLMKIYEEAGLPAGVVNFLPGSGAVISDVVLRDPALAGVHFTGSTEVFTTLWKGVAENIRSYRSYPRLVGETGGKNFIVVHPSANVPAAVTAIVRGAFEYQGQKCSAVSRCYIPSSLRAPVLETLRETLSGMAMGRPDDFRNFVNAVIDESSFDNCMRYIERVKQSSEANILFGGGGDKSSGYFVEPTVIETKNPRSLTMNEEIFGPVLTLYIYKDEEYEHALALCDETSPYGLTGAVFATDREALRSATTRLKYAAGNFYVNDKPTGAVVGKQPFGGSRASGTNDKAGSMLNLLRWTSPRTIKENLQPPERYEYPFMKEAQRGEEGCMRPTRLFLEGPRGQGKTTLLLKNMGALRMNAGGFVVRRLLDPEGKTRGFSLSSPGASDAASLPFAKNAENIFLERTESGVTKRLHVLEEGMLSLLDGCEHRKLIVVDEFGGIELLLPKIRARLAEILRARVPCIGVFKSRDNAKNMAETLGLPSEYFRRYNELRARIVDDFQAELLFFDSRTRRETEEAVASFCCGLQAGVPEHPLET